MRSNIRSRRLSWYRLGTGMSLFVALCLFGMASPRNCLSQGCCPDPSAVCRDSGGKFCCNFTSADCRRGSADNGGSGGGGTPAYQAGAALGNAIGAAINRALFGGSGGGGGGGASYDGSAERERQRQIEEQRQQEAAEQRRQQEEEERRHREEELRQKKFEEDKSEALSELKGGPDDLQLKEVGSGQDELGLKDASDEQEHANKSKHHAKAATASIDSDSGDDDGSLKDPSSPPAPPIPSPPPAPQVCAKLGASCAIKPDESPFGSSQIYTSGPRCCVNLECVASSCCVPKGETCPGTGTPPFRDSGCCSTICGPEGRCN